MRGGVGVWDDRHQHKSQTLDDVAHAHPGGTLADSAVVLGLVALLFWFWPDPIVSAISVIAPAYAETIASAFIILFAAGWAVVAAVALFARVKFGPA